MMDDIRLIRNKLFHFKGDTSAIERHKLKFCANWYTNHPPVLSDNERVSIVVSDSVVGDNTNHQEVIPEVPIHQKNAFSKNLYRIVKSKYEAIGTVLDDYPHSVEDGEIVAVSIEYLNEAVSNGLPQAARESLNWWIRPSVYSSTWIERGWKPVNIDHKAIRFQKQPIPTATTPINLHDYWDIAYWCAKFSCSEAQLIQAARVVGPIPDDIEKYLSSPSPV